MPDFLLLSDGRRYRPGSVRWVPTIKSDLAARRPPARWEDLTPDARARREWRHAHLERQATLVFWLRLGLLWLCDCCSEIERRLDRRTPL